jgi:hypothetical protein
MIGAIVMGYGVCISEGTRNWKMGKERSIEIPNGKMFFGVYIVI